jgi:hypothetical protein
MTNRQSLPRGTEPRCRECGMPLETPEDVEYGAHRECAMAEAEYREYLADLDDGEAEDA